MTTAPNALLSIDERWQLRGQHAMLLFMFKSCGGAHYPNYLRKEC